MSCRFLRMAWSSQFPKLYTIWFDGSFPFEQVIRRHVLEHTSFSIIFPCKSHILSISGRYSVQTSKLRGPKTIPTLFFLPQTSRQSWLLRSFLHFWGSLSILLSALYGGYWPLCCSGLDRARLPPILAEGNARRHPASFMLLECFWEL